MSCSKSYPYNCLWDAGQVGFIYVSKAKAREYLNKKLLYKADLVKIANVLYGEVSVYSAYLEGNVIGYDITDSEDNSVDSCWGHYPDENGNFESLYAEVENSLEDLAKQHFADSDQSGDH